MNCPSTTLGSIIPNLVDDVSRQILSLLDITELYELRIVSKSWLDEYNSYNATYIMHSLKLYQWKYNDNYDLINNDMYEKYKPIVSKICQRDNINSLTEKECKEIVTILKKTNEDYQWIRCMISHYIKNNDIGNLHLFTNQIDYSCGYAYAHGHTAIWTDSTILLQALELRNEDMIKYCFYHLLDNYCDDTEIIKFDLPVYIDLGNLSQYFDFSLPYSSCPYYKYNGSDLHKYLPGNLYIPPKPHDIKKTYYATYYFKSKLCKRQINKILDKHKINVDEYILIKDAVVKKMII